MAKNCLSENISYPKINEVPFDTDRKRLSTIHQAPHGVVLYCKGALEMLLPLCQQVQTSTGITSLTSDLKQAYLEAQEVMAAKGLRI